MRGLPCRPLINVTLLLTCLWLTACASAPFRHQPLDHFDIVERAEQQQSGDIQVRASVPSDDEAQQLFGIPIHERGIQAVWLEVSNQSDYRARVVLSSIDHGYFPPMEVAYMFRKRFSTQGWMDLETYLYENALPRQIMAGETAAGFVFTHRDPGTKAFNVDVRLAKEQQPLEQFTFFVPVPGFVPDHASVEFSSLYAPDEVRELDRDGLRRALEQLPCCSSDQAGVREGRPVAVVIVARGAEILQALLRSGWNETSYERDAEYLAAAEYLFSRPPDAIFRKGRDRTTERLELALWLAPYRVDGKAVWFGQTRHAIGRRYEIGELFLGVKLDPDMTEGRDYLLQDLWYGQALQHWAWSASGAAVPSDAPRLDFSGNPWFMRDEYRLVMWLSGKPIALKNAMPIYWDRGVKSAEVAP